MTQAAAVPHPLFDLRGRTALVTGSSRGIGRALAEGLASAGARVVLNGRDAAGLEQALQAMQQQGHSVLASRFDVGDEAAVQSAIAGLEASGVAIDVLVNNSGINLRGPLENYPTADWNRILQTNVTGVFLCSRAAARHMIGRKRGKIINILSVNAECARQSIAPYSMTKGALKMLTKGMCVDWARHGLQINGIGPGYFETDLTRPLVQDPEFSAWIARRVPTGRWGQVPELAGAAIFLASAASDFVNGHVLYVDGGMTASL